MSDSNSKSTSPVKSESVWGDAITGEDTEQDTVLPDSKGSDVDLGFSMRMNESQPESEIPPYIFTVRPDTKGPRTVGVLLILGSFILFGQALGDIGFHQAEDLSDEEVNIILDVPNSQGDGTEDISAEQYQSFHDAARESGGYAIRGYGLASASIMLFLGGGALLFLKGAGAKLAVGGAVLGMGSGISGSLLIKGAADAHLAGVLLVTYEITTYLCGVCMFMCAGIAALPLINARARLALYPENRVVLKADSEE